MLIGNSYVANIGRLSKLRVGFFENFRARLRDRLASGCPLAVSEASQHSSDRAQMFALYSLAKTPDDVRTLLNGVHNLVGNIAPLPAIMPNTMAPIVRTAADGERELVLMRWGFTTPIVPGLKTRSPYLPNVQNTESRLWRDWLEKRAQRCLVPATSFAVRQDAKRHWRKSWFAKDEGRPLMFFPGIWQEWRGNRGTPRSPNPGRHLLFSILTVDASPDISSNQHALPVVLHDRASCDLWMTAPIEEAISLKKPSPAGSFEQVATNKRQDRSGIIGRNAPRPTPEEPAAPAEARDAEERTQRHPSRLSVAINSRIAAA